jgi:hypothetical protein
MLEWRAKFKPEILRLKDLPYIEENFIFQHGFDKHEQPVFYLILKNENLIENNEETILKKFKHFVYIYELCLKLLAEKGGKCYKIVKI